MASGATAFAPKHDGVVMSAEEEGVPTFTNSHKIDDGDFVTANETRDLKRGLSQRHISLIAIAGAIVRRDTMQPVCVYHILIFSCRELAFFWVWEAPFRPVGHSVRSWAMLWSVSSCAVSNLRWERSQHYCLSLAHS